MAAGEHGRAYAFGGLGHVIVLPDHDQVPALGGQPLGQLDVALAVAGDLRLPVVPVGGGQPEVLGAAVPEAAQHLDGDPLGREDQVGGAPDVLQRPGRDPVPQAHRVHGAAQRQLGGGVAGAVAQHRGAVGLRRRPRLVRLGHGTERTSPADAGLGGALGGARPVRSTGRGRSSARPATRPRGRRPRRRRRTAPGSPAPRRAGSRRRPSAGPPRAGPATARAPGRRPPRRSPGETSHPGRRGGSRPASRGGSPTPPGPRGCGGTRCGTSWRAPRRAAAAARPAAATASR